MPDGSLLYPGCTNKKQEHWNWRWSKAKVEWGIANDFIIFNQKNGDWAIYFKQYLNVDNNDDVIERALPYQNLILEDSINAARGTREVMDIFSEKKFDYPKPLNLIIHILNMVSKKDATILDFFAGSGTTLHATMKLNAEDGGLRKCILVTNNENHICEEVTYERNKRVINGYTTPKGEEIPGLTANTLRYYKTDFVGRDRTNRNMRQLVYAATDMLCIKEDIYHEVKTFGSLKLKASVSKYFEEGNRRMLVIYNELAVPAFANAISNMNIDGKILIYVFAPGDYAYDDEFVDVLDKVNLCALPAAIYNAYQKVLPKRKSKLLEGVVNDDAPIEENANSSNLIFGEELLCLSKLNIRRQR